MGKPTRRPRKPKTHRRPLAHRKKTVKRHRVQKPRRKPRTRRRRQRGGQTNEVVCADKAKAAPAEQWTWVPGAKALEFGEYFDCDLMKNRDGSIGRGGCCRKIKAGETKCSICLEQVRKCEMEGKSDCGHKVCKDCFEHFPAGADCPECRAAGFTPRAVMRRGRPGPVQQRGRFAIRTVGNLDEEYAPISPTPPGEAYLHGHWAAPPQEYAPASPTPAQAAYAPAGAAAAHVYGDVDNAAELEGPLMAAEEWEASLRTRLARVPPDDPAHPALRRRLGEARANARWLHERIEELGRPGP